jgi:hypothetical protein
VRLGIVVQQRDECAARGSDSLVIGSTEAVVFSVTNHLAAEFPLGHIGGPIARTVIHHNDLECRPRLPAERSQACPQ